VSAPLQIIMKQGLKRRIKPGSGQGLLCGIDEKRAHSLKKRLCGAPRRCYSPSVDFINRTNPRSIRE
jgi:hypothetical protein